QRRLPAPRRTTVDERARRLQPGKKLIHQRFAPAEEGCVLWLIRRKTLERARGTRDRGAESELRLAAGLVESSERGHFPLPHSSEAFVGLGGEPDGEEGVPRRRHCGQLGFQVRAGRRGLPRQEAPDDGRRGVYVGGGTDVGAATRLLGGTEVRRATEDRRAHR